MKGVRSESLKQENVKPLHASGYVVRQNVLPLASINNDVKTTIAGLQAERSKQSQAIYTMRNKLQELNIVKNIKNHRSISSIDTNTKTFTSSTSRNHKENIVNEKLIELYEKCKLNENKAEEKDVIDMINHISAFVDKIRWERKEIKAKYEELVYEYNQYKGEEMLKEVVESKVKSRNINSKRELIKTHGVLTRNEAFKAELLHNPNMKKLGKKVPITKKRSSNIKNSTTKRTGNKH